MHGEGRSVGGKAIIGDADSLIALVNIQDAHHAKAQKIAEALLGQGYTIMYPNTAILEAITSLKRKLNLSDKAELLAKQFLQGAFMVIWVDEKIQRRAFELFAAKAQSKQNTVFDCIVAVCVKNISANGVFSFDDWYTKLGIPIAQALISSSS
ncbi:PIN domain-containing protein [Candidatus Gottesmanbacteria bacterium]|nr:PIN domain-containing protein [Candidatus Gottesmanbacteria bacterium]